MIAFTVAATIAVSTGHAVNIRHQENKPSVLLAHLSAPSPTAGTPTAIRKERVERAAANGAALAMRLRGGFIASPPAAHSSRHSSSTILQMSAQFPKLLPSPMSQTLDTYVTDNGSGGTDVCSSATAGTPMCAGGGQGTKAARTSRVDMVAIRSKGSGMPPLLATLLDELSAVETQLGASESESAALRYSRRLLLVASWLLV